MAYRSGPEQNSCELQGLESKSAHLKYTTIQPIDQGVFCQEKRLSQLLFCFWSVRCQLRVRKRDPIHGILTL